MSTETALLAAVRERPHDDTPRLVYADWLEETGEPSRVARAEFIRVQCELATLPGDDPRFDALERRQTELLAEWEPAWRGQQPPEARHGKVFSRGFLVPSLDNLPVARLVRLREPQLRGAPLWRYHYGTTGRDLTALLRWPMLHRLTLFALRPPLPGGWAKRLARSKRLRNVSELAFIECPVTADDLRTLLDAWAGRRLTDLWLNACPVGDEGFRVLAAHPAAAGLRLLRAHTAGVTAEGIRALTESEHLTRLLELGLAWNPFGDAGARHLLRWPRLAGLRALFTAACGVSPRMAARLRARLGDRAHR